MPLFHTLGFMPLAEDLGFIPGFMAGFIPGFIPWFHTHPRPTPHPTHPPHPIPRAQGKYSRSGQPLTLPLLWARAPGLHMLLTKHGWRQDYICCLAGWLQSHDWAWHMPLPTREQRMFFNFRYFSLILFTFLYLKNMSRGFMAVSWRFHGRFHTLGSICEPQE